MAVLEFVHQRFERRRRGIIVARVGRTLFLASEYAIELVHGIVKVARRRIYRCGDGNVIAGFAPVPRMDRFAFEFHEYPDLMDVPRSTAVSSEAHPLYLPGSHHATPSRYGFDRHGQNRELSSR